MKALMVWACVALLVGCASSPESGQGDDPRDLITREQITTLHFVPPMLAVFLEEPGVEACTSFRRVICSGEALPPDLVQRHYTRLDAPLHNLYGPTEAAVDVTYWPCERDSELSIVPIGRPVAESHMRTVPSEPPARKREPSGLTATAATVPGYSTSISSECSWRCQAARLVRIACCSSSA